MTEPALTTAADPPGRRERKKLATRRAIQSAALELALTRGLDGLTVEHISDAADISPRTFFNYFGSKEEAIVGDSSGTAAELREIIASRPAGEAPMHTLRAAIGATEAFRTAHSRRQQSLARQRLIHDNPSLLPQQLTNYVTIERQLTEAMAERLSADPARDLRPALLAALGVTVIRLTMRWSAETNRPPQELVEEAFTLLDSEL